MTPTILNRPGEQSFLVARTKDGSMLCFDLTQRGLCEKLLAMKLPKSEHKYVLRHIHEELWQDAPLQKVRPGELGGWKVTKAQELK